MALAVRSRQNRGRLIAAILAAGWAWTGIVWYLFYFQALNFAAPVYGAAIRPSRHCYSYGRHCPRARLEIRFDRSARGCTGCLIMIVTAIGLPLADWLSGAGWTEARFALLTPGATAGMTAGVLLLLPGRMRYTLMAIPVTCLLAMGAQAWILEIPRDYVFAIAGIICALTAINIRKSHLN